MIFDINIGDIVIDVEQLVFEFIFGYCEVKLVVFLLIYLVLLSDYGEFIKVFEKFKLNDVLLIFQKDFLLVLGFGYCCGFFGFLYFDVVQE